MDERRSCVLRAVVESFIDDAQPVGSQSALESSGLDVSAATVRNELAALESDGYLTQPHTSAGRIPTEAGYRHFVDQLGPGHVDAVQARQVKAFFGHAQGQIEERLTDTTRLLSQLTACAALVVSPSHDRETVRSAQLVDLGGRRLMFVMVTSSGAVERHPIDTDDGSAAGSGAGPRAPLPTDGPVVDEASRRLAAAVVGTACGDVPVVEPSGIVAVDALVAATVDAVRLRDASCRDLYVGGTADLTGQFDALSTVKSVLEVLEEQLLVVSLLRDLVERGLDVAIGSETGVVPLSECAVVVSPYVVDGEPVGNIGLVGPTRMDYPRAIAAVRLVSDRLGDSLAEAGLPSPALAAAGAG
ncbi:MAG TPA: heat-inducible transcriptional repressor HrcA [Acidimicrobiaceae bacterium]|nr:heat-inducible transcriptional repressor HrcA [Acidimicrobiaceae bacterium]